MFVNSFIELYMTTMLDFLISAYFTINFGMISWNFEPYKYHLGEILSLAIAIFTILMIFVLILIGSFRIIFMCHEELEVKQIKDCIGQLYSGVNISKGRWARSYTFIFTMRRIIMVGISFINVPVIFQCLTILLMNLFMTIYLGHTRLLNESLREFNLGLFNEFCIGFSAFFYINFSGNLMNE